MYPMVTHAVLDCQAYLFDSLIMEEKSLSGVEPVYNQARDTAIGWAIHRADPATSMDI
mgnify:CR=1 FL=1|jgi:hypothetical protein